MRLFVAVNLPTHVRADLHSAASTLRGTVGAIRWLPADNYHITLKFLGKVTDAQLEPVTRALAAASRTSQLFDLTIGGIGAFPSAARPRIVWLGVRTSHELNQLHQEVEKAIAPLGFPTEARPFHPHITLGRLGANLRAPDLRELERLSPALEYEHPVKIETVELMESKLSGKGAVYEAIASVRLHTGSVE